MLSPLPAATHHVVDLLLDLGVRVLGEAADADPVGVAAVPQQLEEALRQVHARPQLQSVT